jgi:hypothetical protein
VKWREFITLLGIPYCDALYFMRGVKILDLRVVLPAAVRPRDPRN